MENPTDYYITIGRSKGAGGLEVAKRLSQRLDIAFYDKQLLKITARESGLCQELFEQADEKRGSKFFTGINMAGFSTIYGDLQATKVNSREELFRIQSQVMCSIADKGPAIFVGRCADYILRKRPHLLNVFIQADPQDRIARLVRYGELKEEALKDEDALTDLLDGYDEKRRSYYNYFTYKQWGDSSAYHVCLSSSLLGVEGCVEVILDIIRRKGWIR